MALAAGALCFFMGARVTTAQVQLSIQPGVQLSWLENTNDTYHLQWSSNPVTTWTDLIAAAVGNGLTNTDFDPFPSGTRAYQLLDIVPGVAASSSIPTNGGFEPGSGTTASNWTVDTAAGGPVYGVRTNDNPHGGSFNFQVHLASTGAGPVVQFNQSGIPVTGGTTYPFTFYANALSGSQGTKPQWRILWNAGGDTGYQTYTPGNNAYALISNSVTAPASATSATIFFHFAGAAITNQSATIDIDDVALGSGGSGPGSPAVTNVLQVASLPIANVSWPSTAGVQYFPEIDHRRHSGSLDQQLRHDRGRWQHQVDHAPDDELDRVRSTANATARRPAADEPAYNRVGNHQRHRRGLDFQLVARRNGLSHPLRRYQRNHDQFDRPRQCDHHHYFRPDVGRNLFRVDHHISPNGQSQASDATITAQPDTSISIIPLFDAFTPLEPDTVYDTPSNHVTRISDRPRLRHAREDGSRDNPPDFSLYDTYAIFYWQQRMTTIEIDDSIGKGGNSILFHMWSLNGLDPPPP